MGTSTSRFSMWVAMAAALSVGILVGAARVAAEQQSADQAPAAVAAPAGGVPAWAFPIPPARAGGAGARGRAAGPGRAGGGRGEPDPTLLSVPNSSRQYTAAQTRDSFNIADWHPDEHPPLPDVVEHGRRPDVRACGYCHLANGFGKPENAPLAAQPVEYIVQQMHDYRDGKRMGSEPRIVGPTQMVTIARAATDDEIRIAAGYFASVPRKPWIRVVEAAEVPVTRNAGVMYVVVADGGMEPIGNRIVEVAENYALTELRDGGSGFIAYVPPGSIEKGRALVTSGGNGRTMACGICHGPEMKGVGVIPSIAGRSPSYMGRQMYDFRTGARHGMYAPLMTPVVEKLTDAEIVEILAYLATLAP